MKQIVSQDYSTIIFPNSNKEFNIRMEKEKILEHGIYSYSVVSKNIMHRDDSKSLPEEKFFINFDGFQGAFCLGEYKNSDIAKKAMRILSDFLSDMMLGQSNDTAGNAYYDMSVLVMPDENGMSQLYSFQTIGRE